MSFGLFGIGRTPRGVPREFAPGLNEPSSGLVPGLPAGGGRNPLADFLNAVKQDLVIGTAAAALGGIALGAAYLALQSD